MTTVEVDPFGESAPPPAVASAPAGGAPPISVRALLQYKWTILLVAVLVGAPAATLVWKSQKPLFQSRGEISVNPTPARLIYSVPNDNMSAGFEKYFNSQARAIRNASVLSAVLADPAVIATDWFTTEERSLMGGKLSQLERLVDALEVRPGNGTNLIDVVMTTSNPGDGAVIVNSILEKYLEFNNRQAERSSDDRTRRLDTQRAALLIQKNAHEATIRNLTDQFDGRSPDVLCAEANSELRRRESELEALDRRKQLVLRKREDLIKATAVVTNGTTSQPAQSAEGRYDGDPAWYAAYVELRRAREDLDALLAVGLTDKNPRVELAQRKVSTREEELKRREKLLDERVTLPSSPSESTTGRITVASLTAEIANIDIERELLVAAITKLQDEVRNLGGIMTLVGKERSDLQLAESVLSDIQRTQIQRQVEDGTPGTITISAMAIAPTRPANTNKRLMYLGMAMVSGLGLGLLAAFVRVSFNPRVGDPDELAAIGNSPFLGYLPWIDNPRNPRPDERALQNEAVRVVRTALLERTGGNRGRALLITSAGPDAGKTTIAVALSRSLAACGKRVLLVDADLRRPSVAERLGIEHGPGLLAVLKNGSAITNGGVVALSSTLHVLPAGPPIQCASETEPLANGVFSKQLDRWRGEYDVVLFDAPPVLPVADAAILARQLDGALFVVRETHCRRSDVTEALSNLRSTGSHLIGTVVFGMSRRSRYESSYYSYYRTVGPGETGLVVAPKDGRR